MIVYKIRRKSDGLYSSGGTNPSFHKVGKTWSRIHNVRRSLTDLRKHRWWHDKFPYKDCEIVEYELVPKTTYSLQDITDGGKP